MAQNILRLVADFKKKSKATISKDVTEHPQYKKLYDAYAKSYDDNFGNFNHPDVMLAKLNMQKFKDEQGDVWELFKKEQIDSFLKGLELQHEMHEAAVEAGFLPKSRINQAIKSMLITLTPPHNVKFIDFYNRCMGFIKRSFFIKYYAVFEQTGVDKNTMGNGYHMHILCEVKYLKAKVLQDTKRTFTGMIGDAGIDIKLLRDQNAWDNALAYLTGSKLENPDKKDAAILNIPWRDSLELPHGYSKEISLPNKPEVGKEIIIQEIE